MTKNQSLKEELLALLLQEEGLNNKQPSEQPPKITTDLPLSFGQQRLWFLYTWEPQNPVYNMPAAFKLTGSLSVSALQHSLNEIVRRHEVLRTNFAQNQSATVQVIAPSCELPMTVVDLEHLPYAQALSQAEKMAFEEAAKPFDIEKDLLIRVTLINLSDNEHVLLVTMHHIVADAWSIEVLIHELTTLYKAVINGLPSPLPDLPIQYSDYALWQHKWFTGEVRDKQLAYWKKHLTGAPLLELPTDFPRPSTMRFQGATERFFVSKPLTEALNQLSRKEGVSLFMTMLAAFLVLLHRYTHQDDIVVGTPVANRNRSAHEGLIGFFVNTLALRTNIAGNPTFKELMKRVKQVAVDALTHQEMPFEQLVDALELERSLSHTPLFQVLFFLQTTGVSELTLPGLTIKPLDIDNHTSKFDLTMAFHEEPERLKGELEYNTTLFAKSTITSMIRHFLVLSEGIAANPDESVLKLPLLTEAERRKLLYEWSGAQRVDYPRDSTIVELFEAQAAHRPEANALVFPTIPHGEKTLTYKEVNDRANQLAHYLRSIGVNTEHLVGLFMERSLDMVVSLLGILKAGAAYVPIETAYPQERIAFMIEDSQASVVITSEKLSDKLPKTSARLICLDRDWHEIAHELTDNPASSVTADNLAYVTYTSGSTGRPKGVSVVHRGVVRLVKGANYVKITEDEVFLQFTPISFDVSTFEIWASLLNGARLVIMPPQRPTLQELEDVIAKYQVTVLWLSAGFYHLVVEDRPEVFKPVRQLLAGGDVVSAAHVEKTLSLYPSCTVINSYGPTENTTFTCCHAAQGNVSFGTSFPIGRPVSNTEVYILNDALEPVPAGVVGELYTAGDGLARGYWNRPDLTADRFIPNPFSNQPGDRLYKIGDLVRYLPDGTIIFLGRADHQVKIRGFRIELGETEATLMKHPAVKNAAVVARKGQDREKQLIAYVVTEGKQAVKPGEFELFLQKTLPDYMIPSAFIALDTMPLTPNGKVDRAALPEVNTTVPQKPYIAPRSSTEQTIVTLIEELLKHERVSVDDNFFELGGHSLLATQLVSRINNDFKLRLSPRALFENPTAAALTQYVETLKLTAENAQPPCAGGDDEEEGIL